VFHDPQAVFILPPFLETLPDEHYLSGFAEIIKSALLSGNFFPDEFETKDIRDGEFILRMIKNAVKYKCDLVARDPFDRSVRRVLNFGHTVGHAMESLFNNPGMPGMLHGEAVATGMLCEAHISAELKGLPDDDYKSLEHVVRKYFKLKLVHEKHFDDLFRLMDHDKKKTGNLLNFTLLQKVGEPLINCIVNKSVVLRSLKHYNQNCQQ
jgi:3-dehydroquinate synthase